MNENQLRTLKKYLRCLGTEVEGVEIDDNTRGQKKAYRQILEIVENPHKNLSNVVENNLNRLLARTLKKCDECGGPFPCQIHDTRS